MNIKKRVQEILAQFELNFTIIKKPLFMSFKKDGKKKTIKSDYYGLLNDATDEIINTVRSGYRVSQNQEVVELVLAGAAKFPQLKVTKGGSLNGGRKIFLQLEIEGITRIGSDHVKRFVTIIDSNDGSTSLSVGVGDFTMSCSNQFYYFYKNGEAKFRHSASMDEKIKQIPELIELSLTQSDEMVELYRSMVNAECERTAKHGLVEHILGINKNSSVNDLNDASTRVKNQMEQLYDHIDREMNQKGNNLWGLHSGVTSWTTHEKSAPSRDNGRIESVMIGNNYKTNQKSLEYVSALLAQQGE